MGPDDEHRAQARGLDDEARLPDIEDLFSTGPERSPDELREDIRHLLGIGTPRVRYREPYPGIRELREDLGL